MNLGGESLCPTWQRHRIKHIAQGFQGGEQLCDAAGKENDADNFKDFIDGSAIVHGKFGVDFHGVFDYSNIEEFSDRTMAQTYFNVFMRKN